MKKTIVLMLLTTLITLSIPLQIIAEEDWWNRDTYPLDLENGQILSENPYIIVEREDWEFGSIIYIKKYTGWIRQDNDLIVKYDINKLDPKTGEVFHKFTASTFVEDYFVYLDLSVYNQMALPPIWDRPITDAQAKEKGVEPVKDVLSDVRNHWAYSEVFYLLSLKAINGYPDGTFKPNNNITREEFVKVITLAIGIQESNLATNIFTDVAENRWSNKIITSAIEKGIIVPEEYPNYQFEPSKKITREEIAVMVVRALGKEDEAQQTTANLSFEDQDTITRSNYVQLATDLEIIKGYEDHTFRPTRNATRAEASVMIVRSLYVE